MVLCQIVVNSATYSLYAINTFGRKNIKLLRIDYRFGVGADKLIYLESNILRLPLSNFPFFVLFLKLIILYDLNNIFFYIKLKNLKTIYKIK